MQHCVMHLKSAHNLCLEQKYEEYQNLYLIFFFSFFVVKLGFIWVCIIFIISAQKHRLWVRVRTVPPSNHNLCLEQKYEEY